MQRKRELPPKASRKIARQGSPNRSAPLCQTYKTPDIQKRGREAPFVMRLKR